ncbi:hypothetical protein [Spiroplasma endosymbiont of Agriotes lineatus]|uniref:hypothetical protein n=1 Tax=Spiroplasma endosymbiont of Agriotes lineatus TaxID=3077930 RepID=UPI0030CF5B64
MFMKIFTVLIISFNNIFTIPQNINNDEIITQSLIRNKRESNKIYNFEIKNLEKVEFWISNTKIVRVQIYKKDNSSLNEKLPELKNLNNFTFLFTQKFQNNQIKQEEIRQLITTHGTKIENEDDKWVINKKITIKAQGTELNVWTNNNLTKDYFLENINEFKLIT